MHPNALARMPYQRALHALAMPSLQLLWTYPVRAYV